MFGSSRLVRAIAAACLAVLLIWPATVAGAADPQSADPAAAVALTGRLQGSLAAAPAGGWRGSIQHFAYYAFQYPGDERTVTVNMQVYPDDETILDQVGFVVYGPRTLQDPMFAYVEGGVQPRQAPNVSANLISKDAGSYLVQVRNDARVPVYFTIWADGLMAGMATIGAPVTVLGLPPGVMAAPALPARPRRFPRPRPLPAPTAAPADGDRDIASHAFTGRLASNEYRLFAFDYPGGEVVYTVNLQMYPDDPTLLERAGFQIFQPDGTLQVKGGAQPATVAERVGQPHQRGPGRVHAQDRERQPERGDGLLGFAGGRPTRERALSR